MMKVMNTIKVTDKYGRSWEVNSLDELCGECGQPDNVGDCEHARISDEDVLILQYDSSK